MTEPEFEYRIARREEGRAWAVEYRSDPLETWGSMGKRFRSRESAKAYVVSQTNKARVEEKPEELPPRDWYDIAFALFFALFSFWTGTRASIVWAIGFFAVGCLFLWNAWQRFRRG